MDTASAWMCEEVAAIMPQLEQACRDGEPAEAESVEQLLVAAVERQKTRRAAAERRTAVIASLQELGYELEENLNTATVKNQRLYFQRADEADYGVEVVTNDDASLVQTAMVRFGENEPTDRQQQLRDREREEAWCTDHAAFRQGMAARGWNAPLKVALAPGEQPMRVLESARGPKRRTTTSTPAVVAPRLRERRAE